MLQEPHFDKQDLPFVATLEPARRAAVEKAVETIKGLDFLVDEPLALPLEPTLAGA